MTTIASPAADEYEPYFGRYIQRIPEGQLFVALAEQVDALHALLDGVAEAESLKLHEPYTWSLRQVIGHCIDTERIFGYRVHCIAAGDTTHFPGFDQDEYVREMPYDDTSLDRLLDEFVALRKSHIAMLQRLPEAAWDRRGMASGGPLSVRAGAFVLAGHVHHHLEIMRRRLES